MNSISKVVETTLPAETAYNPVALKEWLGQIASKNNVEAYQLTKRSIDARGRQVKINITAEPKTQDQSISFDKNALPYVGTQSPLIIVGAGPAGLFAAIKCIEMGRKPIIIERGSDVRARRRDLAAINKDHIVNPESNYCFGEGGAGTYSDGKLYTRSKKRGDIRRVLEILVNHGATEEILADAHPHIGTNKLPMLIQQMRETILAHGGEIYFNTSVTELVLKDSTIKGVVIKNGDKITADAVILATGHSARDVFFMLNKQGISIEAKPFAIGVRVEHPQALIDSIQYHTDKRNEWLPAASYSLVEQVNYQGVDKGVFSFCMCPGGFIVPAATAQQEVVVNGMSPSRRDSKYANSGIVVSVDEENWKQYDKHGPLAGLLLQMEIEKAAWVAGGSTQTSPAQRLTDFVEKRTSSTLPNTSYQPGTNSVRMQEVLPAAIAVRLEQGFKAFGKKMKGYYSSEAIILGVESRTSSPVRIPRDKETCEHPQIKGLYPCGEGAGYAGGIVSAAMDGERCAASAVNSLNKKAVNQYTT